MIHEPVCRGQPASEPRVLGGLMRWRMQANGYSAGQAWFWETNWVYGMGLLGYGAYLLLAGIVGWLTGNLRIDLTVFHGLVWAFFVLAHLPDLLGSADTTARPTAGAAPADQRAPEPEEDPGEDAPAAGGPGASGGSRWASAAGWCLAPPILIGLVNLGIAFQSDAISRLLIRVVPAAGPIPLVALTHLAIVLSGYAVHGLFNALVLLLFSRAYAPVTGPREEHPGMAEERAATAPRAPAQRMVRALTRASRPPVVPLALLIDHLKTLPEKELRPTLRLMGAVATGDVQRLTTPLLADTTMQIFCHADGSFSGAVLARFLQNLPRIRDFVPRSALGRKVYRPAARKLLSVLGDVRVPSWNTWLDSKDSGLQKFARLVQAAPLDMPILILSFGAGDPGWARALKQLLDHHLRRAALHHLVRVIVGRLPSAGRASPPPAWSELEDALRERGVREPEPRIASAVDGAFTGVTVAVLVDGLGGHPQDLRSGERLPAQLHLQEKLVTLASLDPGRSGLALDPGNPPLQAGAARRWVQDAEATAAGRILPVLQAKAAEFPPAVRGWETQLEPPLSESDRARVGALRQALREVLGSRSMDAASPSMERWHRLLWALARRDATVLLGQGVPPEMADRLGAADLLDDAVLWGCLRHAAYLHEVIPSGRAHEYRALIPRLAACLGGLSADLPGARQDPAGA